jgi:hypothetical protein
MLQLQLYIDGQEVELHDNESVVLTQSLQDILDIQKVFTDYTRTFNVPASKNNNKIFKHYHNPIIKDTDTLVSRPAELHLNHEPFRSGRIKQESVELQNGSPLNYRITFFGNTIQLKEIIGDAMLSDLYEVNANINYFPNTVLTQMQDGVDYNINGEDVLDTLIYPLISNDNRLVYNSSDSTAGTFNLYASGQQHGVVFDQLKPAIRLHAILLGIEKQFGLSFSRDFFNSTNPDWYNLYLWLHKQKGGLEPEEGESVNYKASNTGWNVTTGGHPTIRQGFKTGSGYQNYDSRDANRYMVISAEAPDGVDYSVRVKEGNNILYEGEHTGDDSIIRIQDEVLLAKTRGRGTYTYHPHHYIEVGCQTNATITLSVIIYDRLKIQDANSAHATQSYSFTNTYSSTIAAEMPKMKVIDFITSLFKMFNLTAYYNGDKIEVLTLDDFYAESTNVFDITKYIDKQKTEVKINYPFSNVSFKYKGLDTFLASFHSTFFKEEWGSLTYQNDADYTSDSYNIELPFEHHKFERFPNTTVQWGWSVDKKQEPYLGNPFIFYAHKVTNGTTIQFTETLGGTMHQIDDYYIPSNNADPTDNNSQSIHFGAEKNEYTANFAKNSLFLTYYKTYIEEVFDSSRRIFTFKAFLPLSVLSNISLNDRVVIFDELYKINKLTTNFETNVSTLELVNETQEFTFEPNDVVKETVQTVDASIATADNTDITADKTILIF